MAAVRFSAAGEVLYAYLSGEVDHDAAQSLRIQLDDALVSRTPQTLVLDFSGVGFMDSSWGGSAAPAPSAPPCRSSMRPHSCAGCCSWPASGAQMHPKRRNDP